MVRKSIEILEIEKRIRKEDHQKKHQKLHKNLSELITDFVSHTEKTLGGTPILELIEWSYMQTANPTEREGE